MEKLPCPSCRGPVDPGSGRGRPPVYCSVVCRRLAELRLKILLGRIDKSENGLRSLAADDSWILQEPERELRVRLLTQWLAEDRSELRLLLGKSSSKMAKKNDDRP